jgi:hypothetical protein
MGVHKTSCRSLCFVALQSYTPPAGENQSGIKINGNRKYDWVETS